MGTDYAFYAQRSMLIKGKVAYIKKDLVSVQWPVPLDRTCVPLRKIEKRLGCTPLRLCDVVDDMITVVTISNVT